MTVLLTGSFFATTGFFTTVALLPSLESLIVLPLPLVARLTGGGAGVALPLPVALVVAGFGSAAFRVAVPRVALAFSTMFVRIPAAPPDGTGAVGFSGDTGRARPDFAGSGRIGECGSVLEFADLGDNTWDGLTCDREAVLCGGAGPPRTFFLGFSICSFSLSIAISSL
jgi:hypothetical protein